MDKPNRAEILDALICVVADHCTVDGKLNSCGMHSDADAIRLLAREGLVEIETDHGRIVTGAFVEGVG